MFKEIKKQVISIFIKISLYFKTNIIIFSPLYFTHFITRLPYKHAVPIVDFA